MLTSTATHLKKLYRLSKLTFLSLTLGLTLLGCAGKEKKETPELSEMSGKKVALIDLQGEATAKKVIEVALVNQLIKSGDFILVAKQDVEVARTHPDQDPLDLDGIAKRAGADYSLRAKIVEFDATEREGYSALEEEDSQLAEERGKNNAKTKRYYKVKSLKSNVRVQLFFTNLETKDIQSGMAEYSDEVIKEGQKEAIHLPAKLSFLEKTANEAFRRFFEKYQ